MALPTGAANCGLLILAVLEEQPGSKERDLPILKQELGRMQSETGGSTHVLRSETALRADIGVFEREPSHDPG